MDAELFNDWFHLADLDHNGVISGAEAVEFFQRSALSQDTLFQVPYLSQTAQLCRLQSFPHTCSPIVLPSCPTLHATP